MNLEKDIKKLEILPGKLIVEINCKSKDETLNSSFWKKLIYEINKSMKSTSPLKKLFISLSIVNKQQIQKLNKNFRKKDYVTDVLSFPQKLHPTGLLGDIVICRDKIYEQAKQYNHSVKREAAFLFTHGLLHLLGYNHENKEDENLMFDLQDKILDSIGLTR